MKRERERERRGRRGQCYCCFFFFFKHGFRCRCYNSENLQTFSFSKKLLCVSLKRNKFYLLGIISPCVFLTDVRAIVFFCFIFSTASVIFCFLRSRKKQKQEKNKTRKEIRKFKKTKQMEKQ